jgi:hypothetical protein
VTLDFFSYGVQIRYRYYIGFTALRL